MRLPLILPGSALMLALSFSFAFAQTDTCPAIVQNALEALDGLCADVGRNQACYGNINLLATPQEEVTQFDFDSPGDITNVADIRTLELSPMNIDIGAWGLALMRLQANLPDTLPGQNVTFLIFGDVEVTNVVGVEVAADAPEIELNASGGVNVRAEPSTQASIVGGLSAGQTVTASGRNEDGTWLRIQLEDGTTGWVFAELVAAAGDVSTLPVVDPADPLSVGPAFRPMQAFYFQSGVGDAPCAEAPNSGLLVQTPEGAAEITLQVNGVEVVLGSTAFFQAAPDDEMKIAVIEGRGRATAAETTVAFPEGTQVRVPLDEDGLADGPPSDPEPYDEETVRALPVNILPRPVTTAAPLTADEIAALGLPRAGVWSLHYDPNLFQCAANWTWRYEDGEIFIQPSSDGAVLRTGFFGDLTRVAFGQYSGTYSSNMTDSAGQVIGTTEMVTTLNVIEPTLITGTTVRTASFNDGRRCVMAINVTLMYIES